MTPIRIAILIDMPLGYLFSVTIVAFCTATAVIGPRPAHTTQNFWGFWATFLINELPFLALYVLAGNTAIAFAQGDLVNPVGLTTLAIALVTTGGLVVLVRRALATEAALRRSLHEFGIDLPPQRRPWAHILLAPFLKRRRNVVRVGNLAYGDAGRRNLLDVYHHRNRPTGGPVLVFFHGGGFRIGHKRKEGRALLYALAARGWVCVSANYPLSRPFPEAHVDAKRVIAWVRARYEGEIIVSGSSAGAHLASMTALTPNDPAFQPGFESADTSVSGVVGFYGYYGPVDGPGSSPLDHLRDAPPFLFLHGDLDSSTLVEDTREFVARLREVSTQPVVYAELPGAQHTYDLYYSLRYSQIIEAVAAFGTNLDTRGTTRRRKAWDPPEV
ncbi:alpha/beta hydrolase [Cryptosporangium sp. NPDC048952]|uniref:alpha/beta hydrolase n=1 Tax=Cryptosporangium sp. NPDC048952 TaxID=3363961 RepID=UPI00371382DA